MKFQFIGTSCSSCFKGFWNNKNLCMLPLPKQVEKTDVILTYNQGVWLPIPVAYSGQLKADIFRREKQ